MDKKHWTELLVYNESNDKCGELYEYIKNNPDSLDYMELDNNGAIDQWAYHFIEVDDKNPDCWMIPKKYIDWTGFEEFVNSNKNNT